MSLNSGIKTKYNLELFLLEKLFILIIISKYVFKLSSRVLSVLVEELDANKFIFALKFHNKINLKTAPVAPPVATKIILYKSL